MTTKGSQTIRLLIAAGIAIVVALALGLGLGLGLQNDSSSTAETVTTYKLASNVQLDGLTSSSFTDESKLAFRTGMATTLDVEVSAITITSIEDVVARRRRSLLAAGLKVNFEVEIVPAASDSTDTLTNIVAAVTTKITSTPLATIITNLQTAFDAVVTSNAVVIVVTVTPPAPAVTTIVVFNGVTTNTTVCGTNTRVSRGVCVACETGQSNKAGDDPSGADTFCDMPAPPPPPPSPMPPPPPSPMPPPPPGEYCSANQYVSGSSCVDCATGYINDAGTATSCLKCAANYRVLDGTCVACASGDTNDAGDVIASGNSYCDTEGDTVGDTAGDTAGDD